MRCIFFPPIMLEKANVAINTEKGKEAKKELPQSVSRATLYALYA